MSSFAHIGGYKKEEEEQKHGLHAAPAPAGEHGVEHAAGYGEHGVAHPAGGAYVQSAPYGDKPGVGHAGGEHDHGKYGPASDQAAGYGAGATHHEGPLEKVKNKIKGKKPPHKEGRQGDDEGSSSSSSESDGEGGRRKKKHGLF
ncbi:hypothetical protein GOP47_0011359 [Adiantum capillus-veneris]|uniref:Dehydrin n=1 Tax=Adiantum capillus-veneris TaxID=13818 RepID=A0A9D4ZHS6_ADICA|nr:hypothetical protein GOP47_0011359 [Adiantum capillus-veneris]